MAIVFTGIGYTSDNTKCSRDWWKQRAFERGLCVADKISDCDDILVSSRSDTIKAISAGKKGCDIITYKQFLEIAINNEISDEDGLDEMMEDMKDDSDDAVNEQDKSHAAFGLF